MSKYRKKPVVIEAEVYKNGMEDGFIYELRFYKTGETKTSSVLNELIPIAKEYGLTTDDIFVYPYIQTLEGKMYINDGDYIITGIKNERYPCKPDIFEATYELVEE
jgi:hypothetical protein